MKKFIIIISVVLSITSVLAQAPQAFKYQAIARDTTGNILGNQNISLKLSILSGGTTGLVEYSETHSTQTNQFGLFNLSIGTGTIVSGDFNNIGWGDNSHFVKIEMDANGGTNYQLMGISQLLSVPYALHALNATNINDEDADTTNELQVISISNDTIFLSSGGYVKLPAVQTGSVPSNKCLVSSSITPSVGYFYSGDYFTVESKWIKKADMPTARYGSAIAEVNNKIYVIGGVDSVGVLNNNEVYDPVTNTWSIKANMPTARARCAAAVVNDKIYIIGGHDTLGPSQVNTNEEYDPNTNTWTTKANMPTARKFMSAFVVNSKIYVIGGGFDITTGATYTENEEYNPTTNTWATKASIPTRRYGYAGGVINNKIYIIGGGSNSNVVSTNEVYDPVANNWISKASMPTARYSLTGTVLNNYIYAIGGLSTSGSRLNIVEEYNPMKDSWSAKKPMIYARKNLAAVTVNAKIYAIGGGNNSILNINEEYTPESIYYIHCKN